MSSLSTHIPISRDREVIESRLAAVFERAYASSDALRAPVIADDGTLRQRVTTKDLAEAIKEVPDVLKTYRRLETLTLIAETNPEALGIAKALILLQARAKNDKRRFSKDLSYEHSLEVAEDALRVANPITDQAFLIRLAIKAISHDKIEDFKTKREELAAVFDRNIADGVVRMTTPDRYELAKASPGIVTEERLRKLKDSEATEFNAFTAQLRLNHKFWSSKKYELDEAIVKAVDNPNSLWSYERDILRGNVILFRPRMVDGPGLRDKKGPHVLPAADEVRNIRDRTTFHEQAIMPRFAELKAQAATDADRQIIAAIESNVDNNFRHIRDNYARHVEGTKKRTIVKEAAMCARVVFSRIKGPACRLMSNTCNRASAAFRSVL